MLFIGPTLLSGIGQVVKKYQSLYPDSKYTDYGGQIEKDSDVFVFALPIPDVINYLITVKQQARKVICMTICETETVHENYGLLFKHFDKVAVSSRFCKKVFGRGAVFRWLGFLVVRGMGEGDSRGCSGGFPRVSLQDFGQSRGDRGGAGLEGGERGELSFFAR